jgi:hypothetical protein
MRPILLAVILTIFSVSAFGQDGLPETAPWTMKLSSPGLTLYIGWGVDGKSPETHDIWMLTFDAWSKKQVAISGHCEDKEHKGLEKLMLMTGIPEEGDNYVRLHAVIFEGDERDEREFTLTWDPDEVYPAESQ